MNEIENPLQEIFSKGFSVFTGGGFSDNVFGVPVSMHCIGRDHNELCLYRIGQGNTCYHIPANKYIRGGYGSSNVRQDTC